MGSTEISVVSEGIVQAGQSVTVESLLRPGVPEQIRMRGTVLNFQINEHGHKICDVLDTYALTKLLATPECYRKYKPPIKPAVLYKKQLGKSEGKTEVSDEKKTAYSGT